MEEMDRITEMVTVGVFDMAMMGAVMFERSGEVPTINGVKSPRAA